MSEKENGKSKIEIIRIGLEGLDIEAELEAVRQKELPKVDLSSLKLKTKKPKVDPIEAKVKIIADKLISIAETDKFMTKDAIISEAAVAADQFGRLIQRVQVYLRRDDTWALQKLKKGDLQYYYVIKFGNA